MSGAKHRVFAEKYHDHRCRIKIETESSSSRPRFFQSFNTRSKLAASFSLGGMVLKGCLFVVDSGNHIRDNKNDLPTGCEIHVSKWV